MNVRRLLLMSVLLAFCWCGEGRAEAVGDTIAPDSREEMPLTRKHLGLSLHANPAWLAKYDPTYQRGRSSVSAGLELRYRTLPSDSDAFAADYGYPTFSLTLKYALNHGSTMHREPDPLWGFAEEVDYESRIGNTVSLYGSFSRALLRGHRFELNANIDMGVAYSHSKYNRRYAIDNDIVGARWLIHFGAGIHVSYRLARQWGLRVGADYWHVSNGALNRPNKGANYLGPSVALTYWLGDNSAEDDRLGGGLLQHSRREPASSFQPYTYLRFTVGVGMKALDEEWKHSQFGVPKEHGDYRKEHFHHYACYSFNADIMRRYARRWASGIGIDLFYATYAGATRDINVLMDQHAHTSPLSLAVSAKHETFYHRFSIPVSLGVYLYRAMGGMAKELEKPYYETVGLHYTCPSLNHLRIGINVKAHLLKADYTEVALSFPVRLTKTKPDHAR